MSEACAVIGIGQAKMARRRNLSIAELCREAALRALEDAGLEFSDIDAIVLGKTPDIFDGLMMPELYLADALGAVGKPVMRISTAGSVGGHTVIQAAHLVQAGLHRRVLCLAYAKESEGDINWAVQGGGIPFASPFVAGPGGYFALHIREYVRRAGAPDHIGDLVALKDKQNAAINPYSQLSEGDITLEQIQQSPMLWDPVRYAHTCPSSDGACAMILSASDAVDSTSTRPAWVRATAVRTEPATAPWRDHTNPLAGRECARVIYEQAGIRDPLREIDCAELYIPFSWMEPMWLETLGFAAANGGGWRMIDDGGTRPDGALPVNMSGGLMAGNPTSSTGMLRMAEAAMQVRGQAGAHQVDGARTALGHAKGGASSYVACMLFDATRPD